MSEPENTPAEHKPYISAKEFIPEFTPKAIILGAIFGIIFGAASVYLGLKVGLTVSASIPIAVLAISIFKKLGKATILESNMVQTIGSAGESVASGVVFTIPALLFLTGGINYFQYFQIFVLAFAGGILGVLFMVPLRKSLIVKEHGKLPYPEGTACADVLIAGEKGGALAQKVYYGLGIAFLYKLLMSILGFWKDVPTYIFKRDSVLPNGSISSEITPELLGVGYIIGPKIAGVMMAGGVLSYLVLAPLIAFIAGDSNLVIKPGEMPISHMGPDEIRAYYIRYIGAGAVTFGGIMTLIKTLPTIISAFRDSFHDLRTKDTSGISKKRTERELPISYVLIGSLILVLFIAFIPKIQAGILPSIMIVIFGFFFVTVSSRIVGIIGSSSNPISGMTIATIMATCLIFVGIGWTGDVYQPIALIVGSIVCIASANAGATSQDLKTGYIVGATPVKQQLGLLIGVFASTIAIGFTLMLLNNTLGIGPQTPEHPKALAAPQAILMSTLIKGLLSHQLPWSLIVIGMAVSAVMELCGVSSLAFAVGAYLPFSTTTPIFAGGIVKWLIESRSKNKAEADSELGPGALFSSGLIAGGALTGILIAALTGWVVGVGANGKDVSALSKINTGFADGLGATGDILGIIAFAALGIILYSFARQKSKELV
jgi:putative OPT family oligopeptide transporter